MDEALAALNEARERHFLADARVALAGGADMNEDYNSRAPEYPHANITRTRLYFAAIYGWCLAIEWLINTGGADPNYRNRPRHFVPLQCAVDRGHSRAVALLLDMGAGLDAFNGAKYPPLHLAVLQGNSSMVKLLLGRGASLDTQNRYGDDAEAYARVNPRIAVLLADVRAAGGWKRYVREPEFSMLLLRYLCLRGRATLRWADGRAYDGIVEAPKGSELGGVPHGMGTMSDPDGERYAGEHADGDVCIPHVIQRGYTPSPGSSTRLRGWRSRKCRRKFYGNAAFPGQSGMGQSKARFPINSQNVK